MRGLVRVTPCVIFLSLAMMVSALQASGQDRTQNRSMVISRRGVVSAENPLAAHAGASVLAHGGNAVEAAVATNAVMGVRADLHSIETSHFGPYRHIRIS